MKNSAINLGLLAVVAAGCSPTFRVHYPSEGYINDSVARANDALASWGQGLDVKHYVWIDKPLTDIQSVSVPSDGAAYLHAGSTVTDSEPYSTWTMIEWHAAEPGREVRLTVNGESATFTLHKSDSRGAKWSNILFPVSVMGSSVKPAELLIQRRAKVTEVHRVIPGWANFAATHGGKWFYAEYVLEPPSTSTPK